MNIGTESVSLAMILIGCVWSGSGCIQSEKLCVLRGS